MLVLLSACCSDAQSSGGSQEPRTANPLTLRVLPVLSPWFFCVSFIKPLEVYDSLSFAHCHKCGVVIKFSTGLKTGPSCLMFTHCSHSVAFQFSKWCSKINCHFSWTPKPSAEFIELQKAFWMNYAGHLWNNEWVPGCNSIFELYLSIV